MRFIVALIAAAATIGVRSLGALAPPAGRPAREDGRPAKEEVDIGELFRGLKPGEAGKRCRIRGVVTLPAGAFPRKGDFFLTGRNFGVHVQCGEGSVIDRKGMRVTVEGRPAVTTNGLRRFLAEDVVVEGEGVIPEAPWVGLDEAAAGIWDGRYVRVAGPVVKTSFGPGFAVIYLGSEEHPLRIQIGSMAGHSGREAPWWIPGTEVEALGVCMARTVNGTPQGFQVRVHSPADIRTLESVTVVKRRHVTLVAAMVGGILALGAAWIWLLRVAVRRKGREMERLVLEAQAAERAKAEFLTNMSHEIRTPMNGVMGLTEVLLETELSPSQREIALHIKSSAELLLALLDNVLELSRLEAERGQRHAEALRPRDLVEKTVRRLESDARKKGLALGWEVSAGTPCVVIGDGERILQALDVLVGNAIKFTDDGEVTVRVRLAERRKGSVDLRFEVDDTGIGVKKGDEERVFEAFVQGDSSVTRRHGGAGLGLAIAKKLTEIMGGQIGCERRNEGGSVFWLQLSFDVPAGADEHSDAQGVIWVSPRGGVRALEAGEKLTEPVAGD